jgi:hypothetical protein
LAWLGARPRGAGCPNCARSHETRSVARHSWLARRRTNR